MFLWKDAWQATGVVQRHARPGGGSLSVAEVLVIVNQRIVKVLLSFLILKQKNFFKKF